MYTDTWVTGLQQRPDGTWDVITDRDHTIHAEHVVNAGGLWAREVGRMVGLELPVLAMEHHYLLTEPMPEVIAYNEPTGRELPHMIDFAGEIYARQEGQSILLGTYEQDNRPWSPNETPWDFVFQLLPHDLDRIAPELEQGFDSWRSANDRGHVHLDHHRRQLDGAVAQLLRFTAGGLGHRISPRSRAFGQFHDVEL